MSTASHLCQRREVSLCFAAQILHSQSTASVKKAGTGWEHWISQITDHLKPPTVAKRCTFLESRKSPALRGFVAGRWELATTSLYPSTKIERSQTARKGVHGGVLSLNSDGPDSRRPTRGPTPPKSRFRGTISTQSQNQHTGPTQPSQGCSPAQLSRACAHRMPWAKVGAGHARKCARLPLTRPKAKQICGNCYP